MELLGDLMQAGMISTSCSRIFIKAADQARCHLILVLKRQNCKMSSEKMPLSMPSVACKQVWKGLAVEAPHGNPDPTDGLHVRSWSGRLSATSSQAHKCMAWEAALFLDCK